MFENYQKIRIYVPLNICVGFENFYPICLIGICAVFCIGAGAILRKSFGEVPSKSVDSELTYPVADGVLDVGLGCMSLMIKIMKNAVGVCGVFIEKRVGMGGFAVETAVAIVPQPDVRILTRGMVEYHIQDDSDTPAMAFIDQSFQ